jgi:16S rRNA (guanine966-N2)-methyltransferase
VARPRGNVLRIIGGRWRGRRLHFPAAAGLRPTPDRVRETVFNWLQGEVEGARCLDLFAGSGALGLEAASRGAAQVTMVERDRRVAAALQENLRLLQAEDARVVTADAMAFLRRPAPAPFDLVFLDPPYHQGWVGRCAEALAAGGWLAPGALVYLEAESELTDLPLPPHWRLLRSKHAGQVGYHLAQCG